MGEFVWIYGVRGEIGVGAAAKDDEFVEAKMLLDCNFCLAKHSTFSGLNTRSTNLDSWSPEQLKTMIYGGNCKAQMFFNQHGWSQGDKFKAKYTSRAAELYKQVIAKQVAKSNAEELDLPPIHHLILLVQQHKFPMGSQASIPVTPDCKVARKA